MQHEEAVHDGGALIGRAQRHGPQSGWACKPKPATNLESISPGSVLPFQILAPAEAQNQGGVPPFLQLPEPDCEMGKATAIMQDTNAACDAGFAANQCDAPCALQMATLVDGECAKTITGIVDQQDRVPNGLAERIDAQWARCVRVPAPELVALLAEVSCSRGGGHRRLQGASAEDLLRAYAAGDGSVCALLVAAPAPTSGAAVSAQPQASVCSTCVGCWI